MFGMSTALMPWTLGGEDDAIPHRVRYPGVEVAADGKNQSTLIQLGGAGSLKRPRFLRT